MWPIGEEETAGFIGVIQGSAARFDLLLCVRVYMVVALLHSADVWKEAASDLNLFSTGSVCINSYI